MRTALTILVIVALVLVALGAVNHAVTLDLDFLALSWTGVSLFWLSVVFAGVLVAAGVAGAWAARGSAVAAQRRLEKELGKTYKRLREAQAGAGATAVAAATPAEATALMPPPQEPGGAGLPAETAAPVPAETTAVTMVVPASPDTGWDEVGDAEAAGAGEASAETGPGDEDTAVLTGEPRTAAETGADVTAVTAVVPVAGDGASETTADGGETAADGGETTGPGEAADDGGVEPPASGAPFDGRPQGS